MGEPSGLRRPPEVLSRRISGRPSWPGSQPMPTSWVQPKRSPEGASRRRCSVSGRAPAGPGAMVMVSKRAGSESRSERLVLARDMGQLISWSLNAVQGRTSVAACQARIRRPFRLVNAAPTALGKGAKGDLAGEAVQGDHSRVEVADKE